MLSKKKPSDAFPSSYTTIYQADAITSLKSNKTKWFFSQFI